MVYSLAFALQALGLDGASDGELVERFLATRGELYFTELYRRYSPKVYAKCVSMLNDPTEAEDAVQVIFERVLLRLGGFRRDAKFGTWLFSVTNNYCIDRLRRRKRSPVVEVQLPDYFEQADDAEGPDWLETQSAPAIRYILGELSELDRAVLVLMYMDGLSVKEIGETLGVGGSAVKMRLKRARDRARKLYDAWASRHELSAA